MNMQRGREAALFFKGGTMSRLKLPSVEYLKECFSIDERGEMTWLIRPRHHFKTDRGWKTFNSQWAGKKAGAETTGGYLVICINKRLYKVHRIVFSIHNGEHPIHDIDHADGNTRNNAPTNLRDATATNNQLNKRAWNRSTGVKCVYPSGKKFYSKLREPGGKSIYLGTFDTIKEASDAHAKAVAKFHGKFGRVS